jgi:hypothetical protein
MDTSAEQDERSRHRTGETEAAPGPARMSAVREWAEALFFQRTHSEVYSDQFNARELERLRFIRWLHQTGRLAG